MREQIPINLTQAELTRIYLLDDRILVKANKTKKRESGIIIIGEDEDKKDEGVVHILSTKVKVCTKGEEILYTAFSGDLIQVTQQVYKIIRQTDIYIVFDDSDIGIRAVLDKVIVKPDKRITKIGNIELPDSSVKPVVSGLVMGLGGYDFDGEDAEIKQGDRINYLEGSGKEFTGRDKKTYLLMRYNDINLIYN